MERPDGQPQVASHARAAVALAVGDVAVHQGSQPRPPDPPRHRGTHGADDDDADPPDDDADATRNTCPRCARRWARVARERGGRPPTARPPMTPPVSVATSAASSSSSAATAASVAPAVATAVTMIESFRDDCLRALDKVGNETVGRGRRRPKRPRERQSRTPPRSLSEELRQAVEARNDIRWLLGRDREALTWDEHVLNAAETVVQRARFNWNRTTNIISSREEMERTLNWRIHDLRGAGADDASAAATDADDACVD